MNFSFSNLFSKDPDLCRGLIIVFPLSACNQQEPTEDGAFLTSTNLLKTMCDKRSACLNKIDRVANGCKTQKDVTTIPKNMLDDPITEAAVEFQLCIINQMDETFTNRFEKTFPVEETNVVISSPSFKTNPRALQIELIKGELKVLGQQIPIANISSLIGKNNLQARFDSVVLITSDDVDAGSMVSAISAIKKAGFKKTSVARKERMTPIK